MERPERIVLFMIGAFTNRMAAVMWVIGVLSIVTVINRIQYTYLELADRPQPRRTGVIGALVRAFYWTDERATVAYDIWVIAILAFVWLTPPDWLGDPTADRRPRISSVDRRSASRADTPSGLTCLRAALTRATGTRRFPC